MNQTKNKFFLTAFVVALTAYLSINLVVHGHSSYNPSPVIAGEERPTEDHVNLVKNLFVAFSHSIPKLDEISVLPVHIVGFIENHHSTYLRSTLMAYISKTAPPHFLV